MKIERIKSILLVILLISSIVLTANKWFSEKLWPEGYNFFSDIRNKLSGELESDTAFNPNEEILKPAKIIINNSTNHILYTKSSDNYNVLYEEIKLVLAAAMKSDSSVKVDISEWNNNLKSKSCYLSYPVIYDSGYFSSQLSENYTGNIKYFKEFIICSDQRISSAMYLYCKDAVNGDIQKIRINFESEKIIPLTENQSDTDEINYYSFELNFDSKENTSVKQPIVIDPDVLINISQKNVSLLRENNWFENISANSELYTQIMSAFGYNTSTIRKYVESDNSMVFVENYSTLKLHSNGMLNYETVDKSKGVKLDDSSIYGCLNSCVTFVNAISKKFNFGDAMYYEISSDVHDINSKSFTMTFDYYINDNQIVLSDEELKIKNAVTVEVVSGKITSYVQVCKSFLVDQATVGCSSAIDAIDILQSGRKYNSDKISDIFIAYKYNSKRKAWYPSWYIENSSGEILTIDPQAEE